MQHEYIGALQIFLGVLARFWPVWLALAIVLGASVAYRKRLGLYGQLFQSGVGIAGVTICLFWLFTAIFSSTIAPFNPLEQIPIMKDALPGAVVPDGDGGGLCRRFDQCSVFRRRFSRLAVVNRKRAEHLSLLVEDRGGPACAKSMGFCEMPVVAP